MIDTGYSGFLTLPAALGLPYVFSSSATLADDTAVSFPVNRVAAVWDGNPRNIEADAVGATLLLGMSLLEAHSLYVEIRDGGPVVIRAEEQGGAGYHSPCVCP